MVYNCILFVISSENVVKRIVPNNVIIAGNPAKIIKYWG